MSGVHETMSRCSGALLIGVAVASLVALPACGGPGEDPMAEVGSEDIPFRPAEPEQPGRAIASLEPRSGSTVRGEAFFTARDDGDGTIVLGVHVENATPGKHAVHIHENGDCSAADASSAGDHWNPTNAEHGRWDEEPFHLGDIGNIEVGEDGTGNLELTTDRWTLERDREHGVLGKAVVVHADPDDFTTQPDGAAADRIACGVIELKTNVETH